MKFSIRDLLLVTLIVALALGWAVDRWRMSARDADWKICFFRALDVLSSSDPQERELRTPDGMIQINRKPEHGK